jgi:predicted DNA-binding transcriptional regulator AlpA
VADALNRGAHRHEAVALVRQFYAGSPLFGRPCHWRTAFTIIRRARHALAERIGSTRQEQRALSHWFYISIIRDPEAPISLKIKAQSRICDLLGLWAPRPRRSARPSPGSPPATLIVSRQDIADVLGSGAQPGEKVAVVPGSSLRISQGPTVPDPRRDQVATAPTMPADQAGQDSELFTARDIARLMRVSIKTVWRLRAADRLPKPDVVLGSKILRWRGAAVRAWLANGAPDRATWERLCQAQRQGAK